MMELEFKPKPQGALTRLAAWTSKTARRARRDPSAWSLLGANAFAAVLAIATGMSARELVLVYWAQSVFICLCGGIRFALMRQRDPEFFRHGTPPQVPPQTRLRAGIMYFAFWAVLHAVFMSMIFWNAQAQRLESIPVAWPEFLLCLAVFAAHHVYSLAHNLRDDAAGFGGDRDLLFVIPFFRLFPMAAISAVVVAAGVEANAIALAYCAVMKSVADLISHVLEHQMLQARSDDTPYIA